MSHASERPPVATYIIGGSKKNVHKSREDYLANKGIAPSEPGEWAEHNLAELRSQCKDWELPTSGVKNVLISRLTGWSVEEVASKLAAIKASKPAKKMPGKDSGAYAKIVLSAAKKADKTSVVGAVSKLTSAVAKVAVKELTLQQANAKTALATNPDAKPLIQVVLPKTVTKVGDTRAYLYEFAVEWFKANPTCEKRKGMSTMNADELRQFIKGHTMASSLPSTFSWKV